MSDPFKLPTRTGTPQGDSTERVMCARLPSLDSFSTVIRDNADGSTTMLRTRGGNLEYTTTAPKNTVADYPKSELDLVPYNVTGYAGKNLVTRMQPKSILDFVSGVVVSSNGDSATYLTAHGAMITGATAYNWQILPRVGDIPTHDTMPIQYGKQPSDVKAYFYTGNMRKLAQFILGIGTVKHPSWYARPHQKTKAEYLAWAEGQVGAVDDFTSAFANAEDAKLKYNYTYDNSYGLLRGPDDRAPWLVSISKTNGVWIYALPMEFGSTRMQFREKLNTDADMEGLAVFDAFGGIPTGELPEPSEAWVRTGLAKQLLTPSEMPDYVRCSGVQPQLGWAFGYVETEARVVGIEFVDAGSSQYELSSYMKVEFYLGKRAARPILTENIINAQNKYRSQIVGNPIFRAKLECVTDEQAAALLAGGDIEALVIPSQFEAMATFDVLETNPFYPVTKVWSSAIGYCATLDYPILNPPAGSGDLVVTTWYEEGGGLVELREKAATLSNSGGPYTQQYATEGPDDNNSIDVTTDLGNIYTGVAGYTVDFNPATDRFEGWSRAWWRRNTQVRFYRNGCTSEAMAFLPYGDRESVVFGKALSSAYGYSQTIYSVGTVADAYHYDAWPIVDEVVAVHNPGAVVTGLSFGSGVGDSSFTLCNKGPWASRGDQAYQASYPNPDDGLTNTLDATPRQTEIEIVVQFGGEVETLITDAGEPGIMHAKYYAWFERSNVFYGGKTMRTASNCFGPMQAKHCYDDINSGHYTIFGDTLTSELADFSPTYIGVV